MFRKLLKRLGAARATALLTLASIVGSVAITAAINLITAGEIGPTGISIAIIVPAVIAPVFGGLTLRLAYQLGAAEEQLHQLAITDDLTQAFNRRHFFALAAKEFARAQRYGEVFSVIIFDMDDFKLINDTYGHLAGDDVLRTVSQICMSHIRQADTFARYGGEEFVFLLPRTDNTTAMEFAERIRKIISETRVLYGQHRIQFTLSMGVKTFDPRMADVDALLIRADEALYAAKNNGKNHTVSM